MKQIIFMQHKVPKQNYVSFQVHVNILAFNFQWEEEGAQRKSGVTLSLPRSPSPSPSLSL